jgi:hypothetical protein
MEKVKISLHCTCKYPAFTYEDDRIICIYCSKPQIAPRWGEVKEGRNASQRKLGPVEALKRKQLVMEQSNQGATIGKLSERFHLSSTQIQDILNEKQ